MTGRHVLEPLLRSITRIYSELLVAALALDSALGGALVLLGVRWPNHCVPIYAANGETRSAPRTPIRREIARNGQREHASSQLGQLLEGTR